MFKLQSKGYYSRQLYFGVAASYIWIFDFFYYFDSADGISLAVQMAPWWKKWSKKSDNQNQPPEPISTVDPTSEARLRRTMSCRVPNISQPQSDFNQYRPEINLSNDTQTWDAWPQPVQDWNQSENISSHYTPEAGPSNISRHIAHSFIL